MRGSMVSLLALLVALSIVVVIPSSSSASDLFGLVWVGERPGKKVEIFLQKAGEKTPSFKTRSTDSGYYSFRGVAPGVYNATVKDDNVSKDCGPVRVYPQNTERNIMCK
jgi:hypothetical protein